MQKRDYSKQRKKRIGGKMTDPDKTDPNWKARLKSATERADPLFARGLAAAAASKWTPWIALAVVLAMVGFGVWVAW